MEQNDTYILAPKTPKTPKRSTHKFLKKPITPKKLPRHTTLSLSLHLLQYLIYTCTGARMKPLSEPHTLIPPLIAAALHTIYALALARERRKRRNALRSYIQHTHVYVGWRVEGGGSARARLTWRSLSLAATTTRPACGPAERGADVAYIERRRRRRRRWQLYLRRAARSIVVLLRVWCTLYTRSSAARAPPLPIYISCARARVIHLRYYDGQDEGEVFTLADDNCSIVVYYRHGDSVFKIEERRKDCAYRKREEGRKEKFSVVMRRVRGG